MQLPLGTLDGWPWEHGFVEAVVHLGAVLQWTPGASQVTYAKLALDFES